MGNWWHRDVIEPGKLPLLVCFAAFVITYLTTRGITRAIRAGRGPFHDISDGGVLDEFALILHLQDVCWSTEGRISVEMISLAFGCLRFMLIGVAGTPS